LKGIKGFLYFESKAIVIFSLSPSFLQYELNTLLNVPIPLSEKVPGSRTITTESDAATPLTMKCPMRSEPLKLRAKSDTGKH